MSSPDDDGRTLRIGAPQVSLPSGLASTAFAVVALPMWEVCYVGSWEISKVRGWFWQAVVLIPDQVCEVGYLATLGLHLNNLVIGFAIFVATAAIGRGILDVLASKKARHLP